MDRQRIIDHVPALRRYARVLTGDAWAADDLVQDTLERACRKWVLWRSGSNLRAWLFTLMHHLYLNQLRGSPPLQVVDIDTLHEGIQAPTHDADSALDLEQCLQRLPADQRTVLLLVALEDMSYADAARVLQIPVGTVMSRLARARARLRELMEQPPAAPTQKPVLRRLK